MSVAQQWQELEDFGAEGADVAFTAASAKSGALTPGRYYMIADQDCHVQRGTAGAAAATAASPCLFLKANTYWPFVILTEDGGVRDAVAAIRDTASGTLRIRKTSRK